MAGRRTLVTHNGITDSLAGWAKRTGLRSDTISARLRRGMTPAEALMPGRYEAGVPDNAQRHTVDGETMTTREWADRAGVPITTIYNRLKRGMTMAEAIAVPRRPHKRWTREDDATLSALWGLVPLGEIAERVGHSGSSCVRQAQKLKLQAPSEKTWRLIEIERASGYSRTRLRNAAKRLGIQLKRVHSTGPAHGRSPTWYAITLEQVDRIVSHLKEIPDGQNLFVKRTGDWRGRRPGYCRECRSDEAPHKAYHHCTRCYARGAQRARGVAAFIQWASEPAEVWCDAAE